MLGLILLASLCVIYSWAFVQMHIMAGLSTTKATLWVIIEVLLALGLIVIVTDGIVLDLVYPGWKNLL